MTKLVCNTRTAVACLGGIALVSGSICFRGISEKWEGAKVGRTSRNLLYSDESPFQDPTFLNLDTLSPAPRTDAALRTPMTPFGAGVDFTEGTFERVIAKGETFSSIWASLGGCKDGGKFATEALRDAKVDLKGLRAGEKLIITKKSGVIVEVRRPMKEGATLVLAGNPSDGYVPRLEQPRIVTHERRVAGVVLSSLVDAAAGLSVPYALVDDLVDLFSNRVEFRRDLQPGDTFSIVYDDRRTDDGDVLTPGEIKAASLKLGDKLFAVVRDVAPDGSIRYFDENGEMPGKFFLRYPVQYTRISSVFATARFHPVLNVSRPHHGVDFSAPVGTPVRAVGDGVVVFSGFNKSTGNMVRIAHDSRYVTEYMHLSKIAAGVVKGGRLKRGQVLGAVGQTGLATGPHLHFGMFDSGAYIDPLKAKIMQSPEERSAPKPVLAMLETLKKSHAQINVASANSGKRA